MTRRLYRVGDRVRVLASLPEGWIGAATVSVNQIHRDPLVDFLKDDPDGGEHHTGFAHCSKLELIAPVDNEAPTPSLGRRWAPW